MHYSMTHITEDIENGDNDERLAPSDAVDSSATSKQPRSEDLHVRQLGHEWFPDSDDDGLGGRNGTGKRVLDNERRAIASYSRGLHQIEITHAYARYCQVVVPARNQTHTRPNTTHCSPSRE